MPAGLIESLMNIIPFNKKLFEWKLKLMPKVEMIRKKSNRKTNVIMYTLSETATLLTQVYEDQGRIAKIEDEVAKVLFERESRDPKQVRLTLTIIKDIYHAWAVDRIPGLLFEIDKASEKIRSTNF